MQLLIPSSQNLYSLAQRLAAQPLGATCDRASAGSDGMSSVSAHLFGVTDW